MSSSDARISNSSHDAGLPRADARLEAARITAAYARNRGYRWASLRAALAGSVLLSQCPTGSIQWMPYPWAWPRSPWEETSRVLDELCDQGILLKEGGTEQAPLGDGLRAVLRSDVFGDPEWVRAIGHHLRQGRLVVIADALPEGLAEGVHQELLRRADWTPVEQHDAAIRFRRHVLPVGAPEGWQPDWGGEFLWCPTGTQILPAFNRFLLFTVRDEPGLSSLHAVSPVGPQALGRRFAVGGWWHRPGAPTRSPTPAHSRNGLSPPWTARAAGMTWGKGPVRVSRISHIHYQNQLNRASTAARPDPISSPTVSSSGAARSSSRSSPHAGRRPPDPGPYDL